MIGVKLEEPMRKDEERGASGRGVTWGTGFAEEDAAPLLEAWPWTTADIMSCVTERKHNNSTLAESEETEEHLLLWRRPLSGGLADVVKRIRNVPSKPRDF